jgi:hypothetical protein
MGGLFADEQRHVVAARGEKVRQLRTELAGGKIREPTDIVHRFISRPGGDEAVHRWRSSFSLFGAGGKPKLERQQHHSDFTA